PSTRPVDGRLVYEESIHVGNCAYDRAAVEPAFCFGHGLGYSSWDYLEVTAPPRLDPDHDAVVTVRVRNTGPGQDGRSPRSTPPAPPAPSSGQPAGWSGSPAPPPTR